MKIVVFIKQVPDTNEVAIDRKTGRLIRDGVPSIINPDDRHALEAALQMKDDAPDTHITVITMGPPQADTVLREALAMGCDDAVLITDRAFAGSDTCATSLILARAAQKVGGFDLILTGRQAIDGDTAQVGPQIAERLNLPQVTYVSGIEQAADGLLVRRTMEDGYTLIKVRTPCLLTVIGELNTPRYPRIPGIFAAYQREITVWGIDDIGIDPKDAGLTGSPTNVYQTFVPVVERKGLVIETVTKESIRELTDKLCVIANVAGRG